jgi:hypothetical protein
MTLSCAPCFGAPVTSAEVRYLASAVAVIGGLVGLLALRDATLSTHQPVSPSSRIELVLKVDLRRQEPGQTLAESAEALVLACRLEVKSDLASDIEDLGEHHFRATLQPSMDRTDQRQFRGCLEDWTTDQVRADVVRLVEI